MTIDERMIARCLGWLCASVCVSTRTSRTTNVAWRENVTQPNETPRKWRRTVRALFKHMPVARNIGQSGKSAKPAWLSGTSHPPIGHPPHRQQAPVPVAMCNQMAFVGLVSRLFCAAAFSPSHFPFPFLGPSSQDGSASLEISLPIGILLFLLPTPPSPRHPSFPFEHTHTHTVLPHSASIAKDG